MAVRGFQGPEAQILDLLMAGYPVLYVLSWEEDRVEKTAARIARAMGKPPVRFFVWTVTQGLREAGTNSGQKSASDVNTQNPLDVLETILKSPDPAIYLLKDLHCFLPDDPVVVRQLRDAYYGLRGSRRFIFIVGPTLWLPTDLRRIVQVVDFPLPRVTEIEPLVLRAAKRSLKVEALPKDLVSRWVAALSGLTLNEIQHTLNRVFHDGSLDSSALEEALLRSKAELIRKEGVLEIVRPEAGFADVGGLHVLKEWLSKRTKLVTAAARGAEGIAMPRGLLVMGVSGCGKSLSVKAISRLWGLPLFRLDMNLVFSEAHGPAEETFHRALKIIEAVAPAILWLDEIEMGLSSQAETGAAARVFAHFLTWMQERRAPVFVAATANRIDLLPAEMIRRGRFDQIFFVDLPDEEERKQIFRLHLVSRGKDPSSFDFISLAHSTKGWNGAEIEQAVVSAIAEAFHEDRDITMHDLYLQIQQTIPLSMTMQEQIKHLRSWAQKRALKASRPTTASSL